MVHLGNVHAQSEVVNAEVCTKLYLTVGYDKSLLEFKHIYTCDSLFDMTVNQTCFWLAVIGVTLNAPSNIKSLPGNRVTYSSHSR